MEALTREQFKELDCQVRRECEIRRAVAMCVAIFCYNPNIEDCGETHARKCYDEDVERYIVNSTVKYKFLTADEIRELARKQFDYFKEHAKITYSVGTDTDGCVYNSMEW